VSAAAGLGGLDVLARLSQGTHIRGIAAGTRVPGAACGQGEAAIRAELDSLRAEVTELRRVREQVAPLERLSGRDIALMIQSFQRIGERRGRG
jgi:hypothetical protein